MAQSAVETVLDIAYQERVADKVHDPLGRFAPPFDFQVKAVNGHDGVVVTFPPPESQSRIELPAIPFDLL